MSTYNQESYHNACEFTVPIKLNIPVEIEPTLFIKTPQPVQARLPVALEPEIEVKPEVSARPPVCLTSNGYNKQYGTANSKEMVPQA
ncbi:MAG: hypothetical protein SAK29_17330 [Scytonema sp. PMC 1069.18]|nr:hypothetical protein [Scytonema sp. PMC 1069.18]MEC4882193.1 hypothetical protein [Scytonema sp. PMC 1070.18]